MAIKVEVHRGRKVTANYQSFDASITIVGTVDVPVVNLESETGVSQEESDAVVQQQIGRLWDIAESELAVKVAELEKQAGTQPQMAPMGAKPAPATNGHAGGDPYGPPKQQHAWRGAQAAAAPARGGYPNQQRPAPSSYGGSHRQSGYQRPAQQSGPFGDLPKTGKQMFPWAKKMEQQHGEGLVNYLGQWAKGQGASGRMGDWDDVFTALAVAEAVRCLSEMQPA